MPKYLKQLERDAYCSALPLSTSSLHPPRISREAEARRPRVPLFEVKREIESSIELAEFVVDDEFEVDEKHPVKVEINPRQLRAGIAALAIRPPPSTESTSSGEAAAAAPGPSQWGIRSAALSRIPEGGLGPVDPPRRQCRPKGSKTRPRVAFNLTTLPERTAKVKAEASLPGMSSSRQV